MSKVQNFLFYLFIVSTTKLIDTHLILNLVFVSALNDSNSFRIVEYQILLTKVSLANILD